MRAALIAAFVLSAMPLAAWAAAPDAATCAARIKRQAAGSPPAPPVCWRIGPVALGMSHEEVRRLLGPADFEAEGLPVSQVQASRHDLYALAFYVFPRDLAQRLARRPAADLEPQMLEVAYIGGRVAQISDSPPVRSWRTPCHGQAPRSGRPDPPPAEFASYRSFAGVREGEPVQAMIHDLGKPWTVSAARDFYNYGPLPLTVGVDDAGRVGGFSIGTDSATVLLGGMANVELARDPASCRITGLRLLAAGPDGG